MAYAIFEDDPVSQERCSSGRASPCSGRESPKGRTGTGIWEDFRDMATLDQHVGVDSDSLYVSIGLCEFLHNGFLLCHFMSNIQPCISYFCF